MSKKISRNDPCPCGSGKKYKQCCMNKESAKTYTPQGKRKFKAKVLSGGESLMKKLTPPEQFQPTQESFEKPIEEKVETEPKKAPRFKKMPSKKPGEEFKSTESDFRIDEK